MVLWSNPRREGLVNPGDPERGSWILGGERGLGPFLSWRLLCSAFPPPSLSSGGLRFPVLNPAGLLHTL